MNTKKEKTNKKPEIFIHVFQGVVCNVYANIRAQVTIFDEDERIKQSEDEKNIINWDELKKILTFKIY